MTKEKLEQMRVPELRALFTKATGETTKTPNKVFLIRRILEAQAADRQAKRATPGPGRATIVRHGAPRAHDSPTVAPSGTRRTDRSDDDIEALQARYAAVVGRATGSKDVAYLKWKIRMAEKGKVRVGPAREAMGPCQVLPLRLPTAAVEAFDAAYRRAGFKTRIAAIRAAMRGYLEGLGERDAAARFA